MSNERIDGPSSINAMINVLTERALAQTNGLLSQPWWGLLFVVLFATFRIARIVRRPRSGSNLTRQAPVRPIHPTIPLRSGAFRDNVGIEAVRQKMGNAPRTFEASLRKYLHIDPPQWLKRGSKDQLLEIYREQDRLRREGKVVWAAVVQANVLLFRPGPGDHPASVIWSVDPYFDTRPEMLHQIGPQLFGLKGTRPTDPDSAAFAEMLTNERIRAPRLKVPSSFTGGRTVFHSSLIVTRKHLPQGYLTGKIMPVWVDIGPTGLLVLVPAAYWPQSLLDQWFPQTFA